MLLFFSISGFLIGIVFAILGFLVFLNNPKRKLNRLCSLFNFSVAFWSINYGNWLLAKNYESALFWARMLDFCSLFIPIFFSHWILTLLEIEKEKRNRIILILGYIFTFFLMFFAFPLSPLTHYYVRDVEPELFFPYWPKPGVLYHFYVFGSYFCIVGYALYHLFRHFKTASGYKRAQIKYTILGAILGFSGGATNYFLWYGIPIAPWGNPLVLSWAIIFPYVVLRYRFMDIRWILGRTGIYFLTFLSIVLYSSFLFFLNQKLNFLFFPLLLDIFLSITSVLIFLYLFRRFEKVAAKYFYYTLYTLQQILTDLTKKLNLIIRLDKLTTLIARSLLDALQLDRIAILLKHPKTEKTPELWKVEEFVKFEEKELSQLFIEKKEFLIGYFRKTQQPLVREEIPFLIQQKERTTKEISSLNLFKEELDKLEIGIILPLQIEEELIGILILGNKLSGEAYTDQEIDLLNLFSPQASLALNNALSYEEIQKRKEELEHFYDVALGRELKMIELKKRIKELEKRK